MTCRAVWFCVIRIGCSSWKSAFNQDADEYEESYSVYRVADAVEALAKAGNWGFLASCGRELLGAVRVANVVFDSTRRLMIDAACLNNL